MFWQFEPSDGETYLRAQIVPNFEHIRDTHGNLSAEEIQKLMEQAVKEVNDRNPCINTSAALPYARKNLKRLRQKKFSVTRLSISKAVSIHRKDCGNETEQI